VRAPLAIALLASVLGTSRTVHAQAGDASSAATELFRQGREALDAGDYATACAKFDESMRLDAHVGTLISLARCEEAMGKLARARSRWQQAVDLAHSLGDQREAFAADKLAAIDPRVPRLTLKRGPKAPGALLVRRDDVEVGVASFDAPLPVEIGQHTVTVSAEGFAASSTTVELKEGESKEVILEPGAALPPPPVDPLRPPTATPVTEPPPGPPPGPSPMRPIALIVGGAGVVALGVGTYLGIQVIQAKSQPSAGLCNPGCNDAGKNRNAALQEGDAANWVFAGAGVALATAAALWFLAPTHPAKKSALHVTPGVGLRSVGLGLEGTF
jgi:hypothetical protein